MSNKEELQKVIEEECAYQVKDARQRIRKMLEKATLSLVGLENRGGHIEIDHCNGRNSVLIDAFRKCAAEEATKIAKGFSPDSESIVRATTSFQNEFSRHFNEEIRKLAKVRAKEEAQKVISSIQVNVDDFLAPEA